MLLQWLEWLDLKRLNTALFKQDSLLTAFEKILKDI